MEKFAKSRESAIRKIKLADYMLTMTYPMLKDPKVLLVVLKNIFEAVTESMSCVVWYEKETGKISSFTDTFSGKFTIFKQKIVQKYGIDLKVVRFIAEMKEFVTEHENSTTEFRRKEKFFFADNNYKVRTLTEKDLKKYLNNAKKIVYDLIQLVDKK